MQQLWGMWEVPLLLPLLSPLWHGVVPLVKVLSMGQIELFDTENERKQMTYAKLICLE